MQHYLLALLLSFSCISAGYGQAPATTDLSLRRTISPGPYFQHNFVTLTFTVANTGPDNAGRVVVSNLLPAALTLVDDSLQAGRLDAAARTYTLDNLQKGTEAVIILVARINSPAGAAITYSTTVTGEATDPGTANNTLVTTFPVSPTPVAYPDLAITKRVSAGPYAAGDNLKYTLSVTNSGTVAASNVVVTDLFPGNLTLLSSPGSFNAATNTITISIPALQVHQTLTYEILATINTSGGFSNTARVQGLPLDGNNTNNADTVYTCVLPAAPARLEINGSALSRQVCSGQAVEFKVPVVSGARQYRYIFPPGFTVVRQLGSIITVIPGQQGGEVRVTALGNCGSSPPLTVPLAVSVIPPAPPAPTGPPAPCSGSQAVYAIAPVAEAATYTWSLPADWTLLSGGTTASVTVRVGELPGEVVAKAANACGVGSTSAVAVTPGATPPSPVIADSSSACVGLRYVVAPLAGATAYDWTLPEGWVIESGQGTQSIAVKAPEAKATGLLSVVARQQDCASPPATYQAVASRGNPLLDLPTAFSPNGDGQNDTYVIGNLEKYPDNDFLVINRWGNQVFKQVNYQNNWSARDLHDGTYFYVLRVKACQQEQKIYRGYITIAR